MTSEAPRGATASHEACLATTPAPDIAGVAEPFHQAKLEAAEANEKAAGLYKKLQWDEARRLYGQALISDPLFLAPRLNIACSYVRQERFSEAADEVISLLHASFVPWARELFEAADLGALKDRPEMKRVAKALELERQRWTQGLEEEAIFFVGRAHAPVKLPRTGQGTFILGLKQEAFAYLPRGGVYRQLTATDGRVLAILPLARRSLLAVVTGDKLVRDARGSRLRGLSVELWDLRSLRLRSRWRAPADLESLSLAERGSGLHLALRLREEEGSQHPPTQTLRLSSDGETPATPLGPSEVTLVVDGLGPQPGARAKPRDLADLFPARCRAKLIQVAPSANRPARLIVQVAGEPARSIESPFGVGLFGLPFF